MPLNGHEYLVAQGWQGKGSGLRKGAISRPIMVAQKKSLAGVGKDRDDAFPFWDHVFNAAASTIKIKVYDSDSEDTDTPSTPLELERTSTGILSNRRPTSRTPALSGTATPIEDPSSSTSTSTSGTSTPRLSVMAAARQAAARRTLYSMFFRGPVLSSEFEEQNKEKAEQAVVEVTEVLDDVGLGSESDNRKGKEKRKRKREQAGEEAEDERTRRKREKMEARRKEKGILADDEDALKEDEKFMTQKRQDKKAANLAGSDVDATVTRSETIDDAKAAKAERKRLRAEKRARKEEKRRRKEAKQQAREQLSEEPGVLKRAEEPAATPEAKLKSRRKDDSKTMKKHKKEQ